jgi:hypothetical protein
MKSKKNMVLERGKMQKKSSLTPDILKNDERLVTKKKKNHPTV